MIDTHAVAEILRTKHSMDATHEYPGFIAIRAKGYTFHFGTACEHWAADVYHDTDLSVNIAELDSEILSNGNMSAEQIADFTVTSVNEFLIDTNEAAPMNRDTTCKHDPGPWRVDDNVRQGFGGGSLPYLVVVAGGMESIHVCGNGKTTSGANARLIAESPEMHTTLTAIVDAWAVSDARRYAEKGGWLAGSIDRAKQILAKLEGK